MQGQLALRAASGEELPARAVRQQRRRIRALEDRELLLLCRSEEPQALKLLDRHGRGLLPRGDQIGLPAERGQVLVLDRAAHEIRTREQRQRYGHRHRKCDREVELRAQRAHQVATAL